MLSEIAPSTTLMLSNVSVQEKMPFTMYFAYSLAIEESTTIDSSSYYNPKQQLTTIVCKKSSASVCNAKCVGTRFARLDYETDTQQDD